MQKKYLYLLIGCLFLVACHNSNKKSKVIPEDQLVEILVDVHLTDATLSTRNIYTRRGKYLPSYYYNSIYEKHGITAAEFDSCINYYTTKSERFNKLYDKVIDSLNRLETKLKIELQNSPEKRDTINLWKSKPHFLLPKDGVDRLNFSIPISQKGMYTVQAEIKIYPDDQTENPQIRAFFFKYNDTPDGERIYFDSIPLIRDGQFHKYETQLELADSTFIRLNGELFSGTNKDKDYHQHAEIKKILIFNPNIISDRPRLLREDFMP